MKLAITGASGLLGSSLIAIAHLHGIKTSPISRNFLNTKTPVRDISDYLNKLDCNVVIHCAANTNVEDCEKNQRSCYIDNTLLTEVLANACRISQIKLVFISSTGIYGNYKDDPYNEYEPVKPTTTHHRSKLLAERSVSFLVNDALIVRTGWLFGGQWEMSKNFVANRIKEALESNGKIYSDLSQRGSPTYVNDLATNILLMIESNLCGIFNCVNHGSSSRFDYVTKIILFAKIGVNVIPSNGKLFERLAKVSHNETAENFKLTELGLDIMPSWETSLAKYISILEEEGRLGGLK